LVLKPDLKENKRQEIVVIGIGCIGLYTALKLYSLGYTNVKIVAEKFYETPSFNAGGLFEFSLSTTISDVKDLDYLNKMFLESFLEYKKIFENRHEFISKGVRYVDYLSDTYKENNGLSYLANRGLIPIIEKGFLQFEKNKSKTPVFKAKTFHIITKDFMENMLEKAKEFNIPIEYKKINSFDEIESKIIFNCSGLGSRELNNDKDCYPTAGHVIDLNNENYKDYDYILRLEKVFELENNPINGPLYFMPKNSGFIGGTYLSNYDGKDEDFNKNEFLKLLKRAQFFFNGIKANPKF
jgi:hypothetical protein